MWKDCQLSWTPADYGNLTSVVVPFKYLWVPDLTLYDRFVTFHDWCVVSAGEVYSIHTLEFFRVSDRVFLSVAFIPGFAMFID